MSTRIVKSWCAALAFLGSSYFAVEAWAADVAYKLGGKSVSVDEVYKGNRGKFYELEKQKYELIEMIARDAYLDDFWAEQAKSKKLSVEAARDQYLEKFARVTDVEINETLNRFKDNANLMAMPEAERRKQVSEYLKSTKMRDALDNIVQEAIHGKKLVIVYPKPDEPIFDLPLLETDHVKYGPKASDTKGTGCTGADCAITVIEYSEFQCPFCVKVLPSVTQLMTEFKGKVRWVVRDFPLGFHNRARPAAVAAKCAAAQGKYWEMYEELFKNQRKLGDSDFETYAGEIGLDKGKFKECVAKPEKMLALIEKNYQSGEAVGVTGTPAFFINGRRISGALPYEEFKRVFDEELAKKKKS